MLFAEQEELKPTPGCEQVSDKRVQQSEITVVLCFVTLCYVDLTYFETGVAGVSGSIGICDFK